MIFSRTFFIYLIIIISTLANAMYSGENSQTTTSSNTSNAGSTRTTNRTKPKKLRKPSPQDTVNTQPLTTREAALMRESLEAIKRNRGRYMSRLPENLDDWDQYGVKKKFYLKFLFGFGYGILDTMTGAPLDYSAAAHDAGLGYPYGADKNKLVYDFHVMIIFKPTRKRSGRDAIGYGIEAGFTHITNLKHETENFGKHYWGIPINFVVQIPLYKMFARNNDLLFVFGPGIFIPTESNLNDVHMGFMFGAEYNINLGKKILMPIFLKMRFFFHRKEDYRGDMKNHIYWIIEAGVGITL